MLKQIEIGGEKRPILYGFQAVRRLKPILKTYYQQYTDTLQALPGEDAAARQIRIASSVFTDENFQIQLLKVGLEEGLRVANNELVTKDIPEVRIADWVDGRPESLMEAVSIWTEQTTVLNARKNGQDPGEALARVMGTAKAIASTESNPSPSAGSE